MLPNIIFIRGRFQQRKQNIVRSSFSVFTEAVAHNCSVKKAFLEISQNSLEKTSTRVSFLIKLQASDIQFFKKDLWQRSFPVNFAKFLRTTFLTEHLRWLLLYLLLSLNKCFQTVVKIFIRTNFETAVINCFCCSVNM